jgi:hypothetical protein
VASLSYPTSRDHPAYRRKDKKEKSITTINSKPGPD